MVVEFAGAKKVEKEYHLTCEIRSKIKNYTDTDSMGREFKATTEIFFLVPKTSTHQILFLDAWLPSYEEETYEVVAIIEHPVAKPARLGIRCANKDCPEPHLIVMTVEIEDTIRNYVDYVRKELGSVKYPELKLTVLPASEEENFDV